MFIPLEANKMLGDGLFDSLIGSGLFSSVLATLSRGLSVKLPAYQAPSTPQTPRGSRGMAGVAEVEILNMQPQPQPSEFVS